MSLAQAWLTMLAPAAAAWAAGVCVPLLVSLYVLKLRRRPVRVSTAMFWPIAALDVEANVPWRTPRLTWLFVLHLFIVLLLCAALGRPALTTGGLPPDELIIVLDRSATMNTSMPERADGQRQTRMDQAKAAAERLLDDVARGGRTIRTTLVSFAADARIDAGPTEDISLVIQILRAVRTDDQPGDVSSAMGVVAGLSAANDSQTATRRRVVLIGDGNWSDTSTDAPTDLEFIRAGPSPKDEVQNLGIAAFAARRDDANPAVVRVFVRVVNPGSAAAPTVLTLALDGTVIERRAITVPGRPPRSAESEPTLGELAVGQVNLTLVAASPQGGVLTVSLPPGDALASDDLAGVTLLAPTRPSILLVGPPAQIIGATPDQFDARSEASALLAEVLAQVPSASVRSMNIVQWEREGRPTASAIIFDDVVPSVVPDAPSLSLGGGLPSPGLRLTNTGPSAQAAARTRSGVVSWVRVHPALRDLSLDGLIVTAPLAFDEGAGTNDLVLGDRGPLIREMVVAGRPHIVTAFGLSQSNWPLQVSFPLFIAQAIESLTRTEQNAAGLKFLTTQSVELDATADIVRLDGPVAAEAPATREGTTARAALGVLPLAGVYMAKGASVKAVVSNVLDERVSSVRSRDRITIGGRAFTAGSGAQGPREIWAWALIAAAGLLGVEWFAFARSLRPADERWV